METGQVRMMSCHEFWNSENREASSHLEECPACAKAWDREQALLLGLRIVQSDLRAIEAPPRLEDRLTAAFRGYAGLGAPAPAMGPPAPWLQVVTWLASAAALAVMAVLLVPGSEPKPVRKAAPNAMHFAAAPNGPQVPAAPQTEIAEEDFIPLPDAAGVDAGEEMNLVRLEFPRSAMVALGFEVSDENSSEPVAADVIIGPDGVARALRFLEE